MSAHQQTVAEKMAEDLEKIAKSMTDLTSVPLPKELILLYVQKKTRLPKRDIELVFEAVKELNAKMPPKPDAVRR